MGGGDDLRLGGRGDPLSLGASLIVPNRVIGHGEIATDDSRPNNKMIFGRITSDPGFRFEWEALRGLTFLPSGTGPPQALGVPRDHPRIVLTPPDAVARSFDWLPVKRRLLRIGYSVSEANLSADLLDGSLDEPLVRAIVAFQMRVLPLAERRQIFLGQTSTVWFDYPTAAALLELSDAR